MKRRRFQAPPRPRRWSATGPDPTFPYEFSDLIRYTRKRGDRRGEEDIVIDTVMRNKSIYTGNWRIKGFIGITDADHWGFVGYQLIYDVDGTEVIGTEDKGRFPVHPQSYLGPWPATISQRHDFAEDEEIRAVQLTTSDWARKTTIITNKSNYGIGAEIGRNFVMFTVPACARFAGFRGEAHGHIHNLGISCAYRDWAPKYHRFFSQQTRDAIRVILTMGLRDPKTGKGRYEDNYFYLLPKDLILLICVQFAQQDWDAPSVQVATEWDRPVEETILVGDCRSESAVVY